MERIPPTSAQEENVAKGLLMTLDNLESHGASDAIMGKSTERASGVEVWQAIVDLVKNVSDVIVMTLPGLWKVARDHLNGKYQPVRFSCRLPFANSTCVLLTCSREIEGPIWF
jgi:Exocyst complex component Sec5